MSGGEHYQPGPAAGAEVRKDGEKWTLIFVRELRHPPATIWRALTEPHPRRPRPRHAVNGRHSEAHNLRDARDPRRGAQSARIPTGRQRFAMASSRWAAARASRSGTTLIAASSHGVRRVGTSAWTSSNNSSRASRLAALWAATPCNSSGSASSPSMERSSALQP